MTKAAPVPINSFQWLMHEWSILAPYNGIHAMRLPGRPKIDRWRGAVAGATSDLGFSTESGRLEQPNADFETHVAAELQRPFPSLNNPLRFFVIETNNDDHWVGVVFDHWLGDDFSARALLQAIHSSYTGDVDDRQRLSGEPAVAQVKHLESIADSPRDWRRLLRQVVRLRQACRIPLRDPLDFHVSTLHRACPRAVLDASRKLAKENGATLHDVFLAAIAQAFGAKQDWQAATDRDAVAIGSPMDLRRFQSEPACSSFGLQITLFVVVERRPNQVSLPELVRRISAQTRRLKTNRDVDLFAPMLSLWRRCHSPRTKATLFHRSAPMVAGLTNVNMTGSWIEQSEIAEYRRIPPTGSAVPMVLAITTLNGRLFFDVTFRTTAFTEVEAERVVDDLIDRLPSRVS